jgi:chymotrypsin
LKYSNQIQSVLSFKTKMKLLICAFLIFSAASAQNDVQDIDWSKVLPPMEVPSFWDGVNPQLKAQYYSTRRVGRIVGGREVTPHSSPYIASLLMLSDQGRTTICGGSLISIRTVMTAAHCVDRSVTVQIILGAHNVRTVEPSQQRQTIPAENIRNHELYQPGGNLDEDIGLLILNTPAQINEFIQTIALPTEFANELFEGEDATISGWGQTSDAERQNSAVLLAVTKPVMTNEACRAIFSGVTERRVCTSGAGGRGSCFGDSGGPLTVERSGRVIQIGLSSFVALAGCEAGLPSGEDCDRKVTSINK